MGKYIVTNGQNLFDVALHIYGSIEGITDLMINNPELSLDDTLCDGRALVYTDDLIIDADVVAYNRTNGIIPANGERTVYYKEAAYPLAMEVKLSEKLTSAGFSASGTGAMQVDWGDNTPLQEITLSPTSSEYFHHSFDNSIATLRRVRIYGDFRWQQVDLAALHPASVLCLIPIYAEELRLNNCSAGLDFLPMFSGAYVIDLAGMKIKDFGPLVECRQVMRLDLSGMDTLCESLDRFLIDLVKKHYGRRSCRVILTEKPSGEYREPDRDEDSNYIIETGMEAVWLLVNEPSWNEGGLWSFQINGTTYTHEPYD